jgi:DNA transformation protein
MALSKDFEAFAIDLFSGLGPIRTKRMFGAALAYAGEFGFALLDDEAIWIKVDAANEAAFIDGGCPRFTYPMKDGRVADLGFRKLPEAAMDDPEEAMCWGRLGVEAAMRKAEIVKKPKTKKTPTKKTA